VVKAGPLTIALGVILGATAFLFIDFVLSQATFQVFSAVPSTYHLDGATLYLYDALVSGLLIIAAAFPVAVCLAHRLCAASRRTLAVAVLLYAVMALATNVSLDALALTTMSAADVFIPLMMGLLVWGVTLLACQYAQRTQYRYDAMRAASPYQGSPTSPGGRTAHCQGASFVTAICSADRRQHLPTP